MGLTCSKNKANVVEAVQSQQARRSPFGSFRNRSLSLDEKGQGEPQPLLELCVEAVCANMSVLGSDQLLALPTDLAQLVLDRLIATSRFDDSSLAVLEGQQFYSVDLAAYHTSTSSEAWLAMLCTPSLEAADLSKTLVTDQGLLHLTGLPRLRRLRLEHCLEITDAGMSALQGLKSLTELCLAGCPALTEFGVRWLGGLGSLQLLSLECCHRVCGLEALLGMRKLRCLNLGWCSAVRDADMAAVGLLGALESLQISYTQVTDCGLGKLRALSRLTCLSVGGLAASDEALAGLLSLLPVLRTLSMERCSKAGDEALQALAATAHSLEELNLAYTSATDKGVAQLQSLTALRTLSLDKCDRVGDRGALVVSALTSLERLDLSDTGVTNTTLHAVGRLPRLQRLNLSFTAANNWGLQHLSGLTTLRHLALDSDPSHNRFTDAGMEFLAPLTNLQVLDVFAARISDVGCRHISKLHKLHSLEICSGYITDAGAAHLAVSLQGLRHLSLAHNRRVTSTTLPLVARLTQLTVLNLSETGISGGLVVLSSLTNLDTLALHGTKVRPTAVEKLKSLLPRLRLQGP